MEVEFLRRVARLVRAANALDLEDFRGLLTSVQSPPARLSQLTSLTNEFGNTWQNLVGTDAVAHRFDSPEACHILQKDGSYKPVPMRTYCTAVVKFVLSAVQAALRDAQAPSGTQQAVLRATAVHLNGQWAGHGRLKNRVLLSNDGLSVRYLLDPFTESLQYMGSKDNRSVRRKTSDKDSNRGLRAPTYF